MLFMKIKTNVNQEDRNKKNWESIHRQPSNAQYMQLNSKETLAEIVLKIRSKTMNPFLFPLLQELTKRSYSTMPDAWMRVTWKIDMKSTLRLFLFQRQKKTKELAMFCFTLVEIEKMLEKRNIECRKPFATFCYEIKKWA